MSKKTKMRFQTEPTMRNMTDGRYEIHCPVCKFSIIPEIPMPMDEFLEMVDKFTKEHDHIGSQNVCPQCGDDRTGKGSLISRGHSFCNENHYELWHAAIMEEKS